MSDDSVSFAEENEHAGEEAFAGGDVAGGIVLGFGGAGEFDSSFVVNILHEAGAVKSARLRAAPDIGLAELGFGELEDRPKLCLAGADGWERRGA